MKQEGHPEDIKLFNKGANRDLEKEFLGTQQAGQYIDAHNMDLSIATGDANSLKKIKGEIINHPKNIIPSTYLSIGTLHVNGRKIEFWVDKFSIAEPVIRIDGMIVAKSNRLPYKRDFPLQFDKNDNCIGGEMFVCTNEPGVPPMIFNIEDMINSLFSGSQKYFSDFNPDLYEVNLITPLDILIFQELENVGGGGGLPPGSYQYAIVYSTTEGDRTNIGPWTPPIPVLQSNSSATNIHPGIKNYGSHANTQFPTAFAIKLKFRVTNLSNYDFIEIIRIANNTEAGNEYVPQRQVVARVDIEPGEISVREFLDPVDSDIIETLSEQDLSTHVYITRAKTPRYHDTRLALMNYSVASKSVLIDELDYNGEKIFPVVHNMGTIGHTDPRNHTYYRSYMGGEQYGLAVNLWDPAGGKFFSQQLSQGLSYSYPNRRDVAGANTIDFSYNGLVTAANVNSAVTKTFEVFDHEGAISKSDICNFKNIMKKGDKSNATVTDVCPSDPESVGAKVNFLNRVKTPYLPYGPTEGNDSNNGHNYVTNVEVNDGAGWETYRPQAFGLNYYAHGIAIAGFDNFPKNAKAFSIVRTDAAKRVVMQGLGMYSLNPGDYDFIGNKALCTKRTNKVYFFSPDFQSAQTSIDQVNDIISNPQNYKVQFVSPLGFFSEVYNFEHDTSNPRRSRIVDMVSYARVLKDSGQINPTESGVGVADYVAYNKYRNSHAAGGGFFSASDGNKVMGIGAARIIPEGRGSYIEIEFSQDFYNTYGVGGAGNSDFNDSELRDWTEPFYIINIIQEGKTITDKNIDSYRSTGHYQKLDSIIGIGNNTIGQSFELVDERWEDCIPDLTSTGPFASRNAYIFIRDAAGNEERWMNATFLTPAQIIIINNDIIANGYYEPVPGIQVKGLYTHTNSNNRDFSIIFNVLNHSVPEGHFVVVRYDNTMPIRVFGGDTTVGETIFAPIDRVANGEDNADEKENQFIFNLGFPFRQYRINPRHYVIADTTGVNKIQDNEHAQLGYIRQLVVMFACESRIACNFAFNEGDQSTQQFFPMTHYVIRPNRFSDAEFGNGNKAIADDNNIYEEYLVDYPDEYNIWKYGGFRFAQGFNSDFNKQSPVEFFSKPNVGFEEKLDFCTGAIASLPRAVNAQNSPGLKTFLSQNIKILNDDQGEIKFSYDATTGGKGENLYAVCNSGICLILTKKSILSNLNADELSIMASDKFFGGEYWITKKIGCPDEMWRSKAEDSMVFPSQGAPVEVEALIFADKDSVYRFYENRLENIGKIDYYSRLNPALSSIKPGYENWVTAVYNRQRNQYWLQVDYPEHCKDCNGTKRSLFVWSQEKNQWLGTFAYSFDQYISLNREVYGVRDLTTYKLYEGYKINGQNIEAHVIQASSPVQPKEKEFIDINVNSNTRPTAIEFLDTDFNLMAEINQVNNGSLYLKKYDGWWNFIPRNAQTYSFYRDRNQSRLLIYKIKHNLAEDFKVIDVSNRYKVLK